MRNIKKSKWSAEPTIVFVENDKCALIPLSQGKFAIVDFDMFEELNKWNWHYSNGYASRFEYPAHEHGRNPKKISLHRTVALTPPGLHTDHINQNRLDNRRINLRVCTHSENLRNRSTNRNSTSGVKGVWLHCSGDYTAQIGYRGKVIYLGLFKTIELAQQAYAEAAARLHGEFARTQ